jgi:UDP-N-acetylglucosamine--N-acetylmuramyl-(pentapeptide) pyrophosphoryl-undecaprenol N-acetylglucosamine transferase
VLVFGGSRGARTINHAVWDALPALLEHTQLIHITGNLDWPRVASEIEQLDDGLRSRYRPHAYLHDEMGLALSAADLVVSRAGAAVLGEYACYALPSILVPYPHAWRYQSVNADYLVERGVAIRIDDSALRAELAPQVIALLSDPERLERMSLAASKLAVPNAAEMIAEELLRLAGSEDSAMSAGPAGGDDRQPPGESRQPGG